tara:strand:- start:311 stop:562 length:252 start_codon:yes stop_codon:yes gene_type:complete
MERKSLFGIAYVSFWVIIWGTVGSLVDFPLLNAEIYSAGSLGQATTFFITALISVAIGVWLYPKLLGIRIISNFLKLNIDQTS